MTQFNDYGFESLTKFPVPGNIFASPIEMAPSDASAGAVPGPAGTPAPDIESGSNSGMRGLVLMLLLITSVWGVVYMAKKYAQPAPTEKE